MPMNGGSMHTAREKEALLLQIACLEGQVQQIARDWEQLGQWVETDQALLTAVQEHTEQVQALLVTAGTRDPQVQRAFTELVIIGHIQAFLLEQTIQREAHERRNLQEEEGQVSLSAVALRQNLCLEGFPGEPAREVKGPLERSVSIESSEELLLVLRHGPVGKDRAEALQDLAELYPEDLPLALVLRLFWQDPDLDVRLAAAWLLSMLGARAPIEDLVAAFLSAAEPPDLRVRLAEMLVHLGTQPALEALAAAVHDPVIAVRAAAVNACASMSGWIPLESLTAALGDSAPQVRSAAALGLGKRLDRGLLDPDAIVVPLVGTLSDPTSQVRLAVVQTFAAFGSQAPIEALLDALQDPEPEVRGAAWKPWAHWWRKQRPDLAPRHSCSRRWAIAKARFVSAP
jgi:hypothetical protein